MSKLRLLTPMMSATERFLGHKPAKPGVRMQKWLADFDTTARKLRKADPSTDEFVGLQRRLLDLSCRVGGRRPMASDVITVALARDLAERCETLEDVANDGDSVRMLRVIPHAWQRADGLEITVSVHPHVSGHTVEIADADEVAGVVAETLRTEAAKMLALADRVEGIPATHTPGRYSVTLTSDGKPEETTQTDMSRNEADAYASTFNRVMGKAGENCRAVVALQLRDTTSPAVR